VLASHSSGTASLVCELSPGLARSLCRARFRTSATARLHDRRAARVRFFLDVSSRVSFADPGKVFQVNLSACPNAGRCVARVIPCRAIRTAPPGQFVTGTIGVWRWILGIRNWTFPVAAAVSAAISSLVTASNRRIRRDRTVVNQCSPPLTIHRSHPRQRKS